MVRIIYSLAALALSVAPSTVFAIPAPHSGRTKSEICTPENTLVRQDFDKMAPADRKAYTDAVLCLMDQPSQLNQTLYPGAINRYFDYSVIHINHTLTVHLDAFFLTWHRMFVWLYEQDLRNICGYNGTQPYWNWPATADNLHGSAVFDGSEYSMSGDGLYVDTGPVVLGANFSLPHGSGGGCIYQGPFAGMNYTMKPIPVSIIRAGTGLPPTAFNYNSSCITRDLNTYAAQTYTNQSTYDAAVAATSAHSFELQLNGIVGGSVLGLHSGAHFTLGSPASNLFVSPQDPIWYPLHTMLDKLYYDWQTANPSLALELEGTETAANVPPSPNGTLSTYEPDWGYLYPSVRIWELVNTTAGPFCYKYE